MEEKLPEVQVGRVKFKKVSSTLKRTRVWRACTAYGLVIHCETEMFPAIGAVSSLRFMTPCCEAALDERRTCGKCAQKFVLSDPTLELMNFTLPAWRPRAIERLEQWVAHAGLGPLEAVIESQTLASDLEAFFAKYVVKDGVLG